jgi:hypothetical protein
MRIHNNFYLFLESVVLPTAIGEEMGRDAGGILGCVKGGSGEPGRDGGRILGASTEAVGARERWWSMVLGRNIFNYNYYRHI